MTTLVTGGTGSFGRTFARLALKEGERVRIFSRDEEKQRRMALDFPDCEYVLGDVRDSAAVRRAMRGVESVFHAAALKQVPQSEHNPGEYVRTNVLGTENVCEAAIEAGAKVVVLSTDKAVEPVGVMGASKMLAERIATAYGFNAVRYGNVVGSRGSIVPMFRDMVRRGEPVTITDPTMTRFVITLAEAISLVLIARESPMDGTVFAWRSPAATVFELAKAIVGDYPTTVTGPRPGEKKHEHLVLPSETVIVEPTYFRVLRSGPPSGVAYASDTAPRLTPGELRSLVEQAPLDDVA